MEQPHNELIYWDKHRIPINFTVIFAVGVAVYGIIVQNPLLIVFGLGFAGYSWLTNARQYRIYPGALVIVFGTPRARVIPLGDVSHLEMRAINIPDRLRAWLVNGRRVSLVVRDPEAFQEQLQKALDEFRRLNPELSIADHSTGDGSQPQDSSDQPPDFT